jgi:3-phosphoshikimate 1-carboxyvinyltransferase
VRWYIDGSNISGAVEVPGDKSIGHRALMIAALASGASRIRNLPDGGDVRSTECCLVQCGVTVQRSPNTVSVIPPDDLHVPDGPLDAGNSGTTMRLLSGILAGLPGSARLIGDDSLSRRPMERVAEPLRRMGANIVTRGGYPPLQIDGGNLRAINYDLPVASAQVKSAILLAGLFVDGQTSVTEPVLSRDHTERMLGSLGVDICRNGKTVAVSGGHRPHAFEMTVPGDASSAAFFLCAAALTGGPVTVRNVGLNETRAGLLRVLERMGTRVVVTGERVELGEPVGDVTVSGRVSKPVTVEADEVPRLIDEIPLVALLATQASGPSLIRGAAELRVKESDRLRATAEILRAFGATVRELPDGLEIMGGTVLTGARITSHGDHRMAMLGAVAGCVARGQTVIEGAEASSISYPGFTSAWRSIGGVIDVA